MKVSNKTNLILNLIMATIILAPKLNVENTDTKQNEFNNDKQRSKTDPTPVNVDTIPHDFSALFAPMDKIALTSLGDDILRSRGSSVTGVPLQRSPNRNSMGVRHLPVGTVVSKSCIDSKSTYFKLDTIHSFIFAETHNAFIDLCQAVIKSLYINNDLDCNWSDYVRKEHVDTAKLNKVYMFRDKNTSIKLRNPTYTRVIECPLVDNSSQWNIKSFTAREYHQQGSIYFKFTLKYSKNLDYQKQLDIDNLVKDIKKIGLVTPQFSLSDIFPIGSDTRIATFCDNMNREIPDIKASLNSLSSIVESCVDDTTGEIKSSAFQSFRKILGISDDSFLNTSFLSMATTIFLFSSTAHLILGFERDKLKLFILAVVLYVTVNKSDFQRLLTFCWESIADSLKPTVQDGTPGTFEAIKEFATMVISKLTNIQNRMTIRDYISLTCSFDKFKSGIVNIFKWFSELLFKFIEWTGISQFVPVKFKYMFENNDDIVALALEAQTIHQECIDGKFEYSRDNQERLVFLINRMKDLRLKLSSGKSGELSSLSFEISYLSKLSEKIAATGVDVHGTRPEPAVLMIGGKPGQLKSQYLDFFITKAALNTLSEEDLERFKSNKTEYIYNARAETKYWDGYTTKHKFCIFDDFGQTTDAPGVPDNEYMKFIAAIGERPYMLHMADLVSKGNSYFNSSYVFATTNLTSFKPSSIISPEALIRRFHVCVWAEIKDEYATVTIDSNGVEHRKINPDKFDKDENGKPILNLNMVRFREWFPNSPDSKQYGKDLTFTEICDKLTDTYNNHQHYFDSKMRVVNDLLHKGDSAIGSSSHYEDSDSSDGEYEDDELQLDSLKNIESSEPEFFEAPTELIVEDCNLPFYKVYCEVKSRFPEALKNHMTYFKQFCLTGQDKILTEASIFIALCRRFSKKFTNIFARSIVPERTKRLFTDYLTSLYSSDFPSFFLRNATSFKNFVVSKLSILKDIFGEWVGHLLVYKNTYTSVIGLYCLYTMLTTEKDKNEYLPCDITECNGKLTSESVDEEGFIIANFKYSDHNVCGYSKSQLLSNQKLKLDEWKSSLDLKELDISQYLTPSSQYNLKSKAAKPKAVAQAGFDSNGEQQLESLIMNNCYKMSWLSETQQQFDKNNFTLEVNSLGMITFIRDTICIMPGHFLKTLKSLINSDKYECTNDSTVLLHKYTREGMKIVRRFKFSDMLDSSRIYHPDSFKNKDLILFRFDKTQANSHRDIVKLFPPAQIIDSTKLFSGVLRGMPGSTVSQYHIVAQLSSDQEVTTKDNKKLLDLHKPYGYSASTRSGDCGSILFRLDPKSKSKLYGFHVAGIDQFDYGYSSSVPREELEYALEFIENQSIVVHDSTIEFQSYIPDLDLPASFQQLYDHERTMNYPNKTEIIPSKLCHKWPMLDMGHSVMSREAYRLAIAKYIRPPIYIDLHLFKTIAKYTFISIANRSTQYDSDKRVLTYREAIYGIEDDIDFGPIDRNTSPGFPFVFERDDIKGKGAWFGFGEEFEITPKGEQLINHCQLLEERLNQGHRQLFIYTDNLKDEKRPIEKIELKKTRLFSGCPLDYLILVRKYFGAFSLWLIKNRINNSITVGINPYVEWHNLAHKLLQFGSTQDKNFIAGDFSGFDCAGKQGIYWCILDEINRWYNDGPNNSRVRHLLWLELVQSRHIHQNHVYEWHSSLPSGHPLTVLVNSIYNLIAFRYCWLKVHKMDIDRLPEFDEHVYLATFGDDVNGSVSKYKKDIFNELVIQDHMRDLDLVYTSDTKSKFEDSLRTIHDISFLKRKFIKCPISSTYVGALNKDVIHTTPGWTKKHSSDSICIDNIHFALREMSLWGENDFNDFVKLIKPHVKLVYPGIVFDYDYFSNVTKTLALKYYY